LVAKSPVKAGRYRCGWAGTRPDGGAETVDGRTGNVDAGTVVGVGEGATAGTETCAALVETAVLVDGGAVRKPGRASDTRCQSLLTDSTSSTDWLFAG
jgi:hypothetical protein